MTIKVGMVSLGCPKNQVDAEMLMATLRDGGYELVADAGLSDVAIVNTCGFIESAKQESIDEILELCTLKKEGRIKKIIVTGCLAERYRSEILKEIPEVDAVVGIGSNSDICEIVGRALTDEQVELYGDKENLSICGKRVLANLPFYAYIKIAEGCNNCCTYCAIPSIRGKYRSRTIESIVSEVSELASKGITEFILVAQDTTRYGEDLYGESKLPELLREIAKIDGVHWIRTLYCYPERITDELIKTVGSEEKCVKYFDIPIQHCNKEILKRMNRKGDKNTLTELISKIRKEIPDVVIRSTLIAGFPGETSEQFEELCGFVNEIQFDRMGCFAYSQEEGTVAGGFPDQIDEDEKQRRAEIINDAQSIIMAKKNEKLIGSTVEVVVEGFDRYAEMCFGRTKADVPDIDPKIFFTTTKPLNVGQYIKVKIDDTMDADLIGTAEE